MLTELLYQPIPQLKLLPPPPILLPEEPQLFIPDMSMDTLDGHMVTSLVSVKPNLTQLSMFSEELQSPLLEPSPLMLTELLYQLIQPTWPPPQLTSQARDFIILENVKPNLTMVSMELTQKHPPSLPPSSLLLLP